MRHLWSIIFLLTTLFAGHADDLTVDGVVYEWVTEQNGYVVKGWDKTTSIRYLHIRAVVNDMDVVAIADNAFNFSEEHGFYTQKPEIKTLVIDDGVSRIGINAFVDCTHLTMACIPGTVTTIGDAAFFRCSALKVLQLNEGLREIGEEAFANCSALETVVIPASVTNIGSKAFLYCTAVTDAHFLMSASALSGFDWYDGVVEHEGGKEFNTPAHTTIHVPQGQRQAYIDSGKFSAWLGSIEEDTGIYPLWWIVNYGTVGVTYTVSDVLTAVYADKNDVLYCKDDNRWLTPEHPRGDQLDYVINSGLLASRGNVFDQSNWVALTGLSAPTTYQDHKIQGQTITGRLIDKRNPEMAITSTTPVKADATTYVPNVYCPANFGPTIQEGTNGITYFLMPPKPMEVAFLTWNVWYNNAFYMAAHQHVEGGTHYNTHGLSGGFNFSPSLNTPAITTNDLKEGEAYEFNAIIKRKPPVTPSPSPRRISADTRNLSKDFEVFSIDLDPDDTITAVTDLRDDKTVKAVTYYTPSGYASATPWQGLNIIVTTRSDGTSTTEKRLF